MNENHVVVHAIGDLWCLACGERQSLSLPLSVADFCVLLRTWTERHTACATEKEAP